MFKKLLPILCLLPLNVHAADNQISLLNFDSQSEFKNFAKDFTGSLGYKTLTPAEPLGVSGFDIGASYTNSGLNYKLKDKVTTEGKGSFDTISLHAIKGLPWGIDFGLDYSSVMNSNIETWGGKLSYALIEGGVLYPSVSINGNYTQTSGLDALDFKSMGAEIGISKGFASLTPYASVGMTNGELKSLVDNAGLAGVKLDTESVSMMKYAVGVNINLLAMDVLVGYNQIGDVPSYSLKAGFRF